jgi:exopolyphosphatase/guanosine-5'-triphosphate,3'-diphosphate pyrophosphatase
MNNKRAGRKSRTHSRRHKPPLYAAVDLGTNNCRLLVAKPAGEHFHVVDSHSQIVRLGEGLSATGRLSDAAMERTFDALGTIRAKLKHLGVRHIRCIATEACRKAENGADFIREVQHRTKLSFKIVSAKEEARLAAIGCHDLLEPDAQLVMVLDIGGGSTEVAFIDLSGQAERDIKTLVNTMPITAWSSFPLGVVTLTESFALEAAEDRFSAMHEKARATFAAWPAGKQFAERLTDDSAYMIGTSGTVTCLAGIRLGLQKYRRDRVDGQWLTQTQTQETIRDFTNATPEERASIPTVGADRAALMLAGCAILEAAFAEWPSSRLRVADRGLREGLLLSMMHSNRKPKRRRKRKPSSTAEQPVSGQTQNPQLDNGANAP